MWFRWRSRLSTNQSHYITILKCLWQRNFLYLHHLFSFGSSITDMDHFYEETYDYLLFVLYKHSVKGRGKLLIQSCSLWAEAEVRTNDLIDLTLRRSVSAQHETLSGRLGLFFFFFFFWNAVIQINRNAVLTVFIDSSKRTNCHL